jgi:hypothetical protein
MHFGLYAFDLFEVIYEESWDNGLCPALQEAYGKKEDYLRDVPRLIIEHNIHGVDIDPRAVQIAGLSLWLRAQKTWKDTPAAERPRVRRSNIVCAEPMPGSIEMLEDFAATLRPTLLGDLVKTVFDKMQLAGEAGTLLKIEEEIRDALDSARSAWEELGDRPPELFSPGELNALSTRPELQPDPSLALLPSSFWETAEHRLLAALRDYAESAEAGDYQRRLFAEDAAHGFAFIDLCRKRYDAVVMNPPFGKPVNKTKTYLARKFPGSKNELYACFVTMALDRLALAGMVGAITSRTGFFLGTLEAWRRTVLSKSVPTLFSDLGTGVLDSAMVETASFILANSSDAIEKLTADSVFINALQSEDKGAAVRAALRGILDNANVHIVNSREFEKIPGAPFAYWLTPNLRETFSRYDRFANSDRSVKQGLATADDFRFIRMRAETPFSPDHWPPVAKGGLGSPFFQDFLLVVNWDNDGFEMKAFASAYRESKGWGDQWTAMLNSHEYYFRPGLTYPLRSRYFSPQVMPPGVVISVRGSGIYLQEDTLAALGLMTSTHFDFLLKTLLGTYQGPQYDMGDINNMPFPELAVEVQTTLHNSAMEAWRIKQVIASRNELSNYFFTPACVSGLGHDGEITSIRNGLERFEICVSESSNVLEGIETAIDGAASQAFDLEAQDIERINSFRAPDVQYSSFEGLLEDFDTKELVADYISYLSGTTLGRWDIRYATVERQPSELPDPFDPLPACPPGMLQNADGLPAEPADVPDDYPLRITWSGILVSDPSHPGDIVARVRDALAVIWSDRSSAIEQEACEFVGVRALRDYFAEKKSGGKFFKDHLKRYSKSRRQAPIYWPLSTESGAYTLWIYYHRLNENTLYSAVTQFIEPRQEEAQKTFNRLNAEKTRSKQEDKELETAQVLVAELATFRESLLEIAKFWKPNLNDGVQITAAPLWKHFRLVAWQKKLKETWKQLEAGEYDWAHLAHTIWPERVIPKCAEDRSLAIAHGHEDALWKEVKDAKGKTKWQPKPNAAEVAAELVRVRP